MGFNIRYDEESKILYKVTPTKEEVNIADDYPSMPEIFPDKNRAVYINPLE